MDGYSAVNDTCSGMAASKSGHGYFRCVEIVKVIIALYRSHLQWYQYIRMELAEGNTI